MKNILVVIIIILNLIPLYAEDKKKNLISYPFVIYTGETSLTLGAFAVYTIRPQDQEKHIPPTSLVANGLVSVKKNALFFFIPEFISRDGQYRINPSLKYQNWPSEFYGIGLNSLESDKTDYTQHLFEIKNTFKYQIAKNLFLKNTLRYQQNSLSKVESGKTFSYFLKEDGVAGKTSGAGLGLEFDNRNNSFYPTKGYFASYDYMLYDNALGSDYDYQSHHLILSSFYQLSDKNVLGMNFVFKSMGDHSPFYEKNQLGNEMRAYNDYRFIDNQLIALKAEFRTFPWETTWKKRLGFAAFTELGQIQKRISDVDMSDFKPAGGFGVRFALVPEEKLNLRMDFGIGKDSVEFMFLAREAF